MLRDEPLVFTGSVRDNVDPFNVASDEEIVKVLHYLGLYQAYSLFLKGNKADLIDRHMDALDVKVRISGSVLYESSKYFRHKANDAFKFALKLRNCCLKKKSFSLEEQIKSGQISLKI